MPFVAGGGFYVGVERGEWVVAEEVDVPGADRVGPAELVPGGVVGGVVVDAAVVGRSLMVDQQHDGRRLVALREHDRPRLAKPGRPAGAHEVDVFIAGFAGGAVEGIGDQGAGEVVEGWAVGRCDELEGGESCLEVPGVVRESGLEGETGGGGLAVVGAQVPLGVHSGQETLLADRVAPASLLVGVGLVDPVRGRRAVDGVEHEECFPLSIVEGCDGQDGELVDLLGEDGDILVVSHRRAPRWA